MSRVNLGAKPVMYRMLLLLTAAYDEGVENEKMVSE